MYYKVIYPFLDAKDGNHLYEVGDTYPRLSMNGEISAARFAELASDRNVLKRPLIAEEGKVEEKPVEKPKAKVMPKPEEEVKEEDEELDIKKIPFFKLKSLAKAHGINIEGKKADELREELAKVM